MAEPIVEQIMQAVRTRCGAYTASYRSSMVAKWQPRDMTISVYQGEITRNEIMSCPGNPPAMAYDIEAIVAGIAKPSDAETTAIDTFKNRMWSEIVKAVTNADKWYQWGGLAVNTEINSVEDYTSDDGSMAGVKVSMAITFRTDENNPFNARA